MNLNDKKIGTCTPAADDKTFSCGLNAGMAIGSRVLNCKSGLTQADFPQPT